MRVVLYIKTGGSSWILIKSLLTPFLPRRLSKASGCAVFFGADIAFQDIQLHTHRNKSELHFMAGHTMLSIPLASILIIEKLVLRDIQSTEYEIITKESGTITLDVV